MKFSYFIQIHKGLKVIMYSNLIIFFVNQSANNVYRFGALLACVQNFIRSPQEGY